MIRNILQDIGGVGLYGIISLVLFFLTFGAVVLWALRLKKPYLQAMRQLPLEPNDTHPESGESHHD